MIFFMFVSSIKLCLRPAPPRPRSRTLQRKHHYVVLFISVFSPGFCAKKIGLSPPEQTEKTSPKTKNSPPAGARR
jgi:hypothetical protein